MRTGNGFCRCAMAPKPERVFYETRDPAEIRNFVSLLHPRLYLDLGPITANCSNVTIDFYRGDDRVYWINLKGTIPRSDDGFLPITEGSREDIEGWLRQRSIREKIRAAWEEQVGQK